MNCGNIRFFFITSWTHIQRKKKSSLWSTLEYGSWSLHGPASRRLYWKPLGTMDFWDWIWGQSNTQRAELTFLNPRIPPDYSGNESHFTGATKVPGTMIRNLHLILNFSVDSHSNLIRFSLVLPHHKDQKVRSSLKRLRNLIKVIQLINCSASQYLWWSLLNSLRVEQG